MTGRERLEYLLPCGHRSSGPACFQCAIDEFLARERAAEPPKPAFPVAVPRELAIAVTHPPHVRRFAARGRRR